MNKVAVLLANGCEEIEALTVIDVLRRGGVDVRGVSINSELLIKGSHNIHFMADELLSEQDPDMFNMVVLPGGLCGRNNLYASRAVCKLLESFSKDGKYVAAICAAPTVLGRLGLLEGKRATCYPSMEGELKGASVKMDENVVIDGNIITSQGPATAMEFSLELLRVLCGEEIMLKVRDGLLVRANCS